MMIIDDIIYAKIVAITNGVYSNELIVKNSEIDSFKKRGEEWMGLLGPKML